MKILYYYWGEITYRDCVEVMSDLGWKVDVISYKLCNYDEDEIFYSQLSKQIMEGYDIVFTFDYFPIISRISNEKNIRYVSWVYDSPHLTLESKTLQNKCNYVFLFDYALYESYRKRGCQTVYYMPLAFNSKRLKQYSEVPVEKYEHEVTFLGALYNDENNFLDQIKFMPEKLRGFLEGIISSQRLIYGYDIIADVFGHDKCEELAQYVELDMGPLYEDCRDDIFRNMIRKKVTVLERNAYLRRISKDYAVDLYSPKKPENIAVRYMGYADYEKQMPHIFRTSKINLNITLRSILSGMPLRMIDILGAGGFLLTNYQMEIPEYFENEKHLVWYESEDDMMWKIGYYLQHDDERNRIAEEGYLRVKELFTYEKQLKKIMNMVNNK